MAFTKYASLENVQILEVKGSSQHRTATLDKLSDFEDYRTDDGYLYARIWAISSRVNKNHDGWPSVELAGGQDVFDRHQSAQGGFTVEADTKKPYGYSTFVGKPIFVDHHNSNPERARGVIVDSKLYVDDHKTAALDPYYSSDDVDPEHLPATRVELLLEVDAKTFPHLAKAIIEGSENPDKGIDGFSMGCDVEKSVCNICKNAATSPEEYCDHVRMKGAEFDHYDDMGHKTSRRSYENCYGIKFFEISAVFDPADETALLKEVTATSHHPMDAAPFLPGPTNFAMPCPTCNDMGDPSCPTCHGEYLTPEIPGGDGTISPHTIRPGATDGLWMGPPAGQEPNYGKVANRKVAEMPPTLPGMGQQPAVAPAAGAPNMGPAQAQGVGAVCPNCKQPEPCSCGYGQGSQIPQMGQPQAQQPMNPMMPQAKMAQNPVPQADLLHAPPEIDTLREDAVCPICGSTMDDESCAVCGYTEPPDGMDNPDLTKAKGQQPEGKPDDAFQDLPDGALGPQAPEAGGDTTSNPLMTAHVRGDMGWTESIPSRVATGPSDEPIEDVLEDSDGPITSHVRTAGDFLAAAGATRRTTMNHTAEAASGAPEVATPEKNVDVLGVGGVVDASNEEASRADAQIDVTGTGGTGVDSVAAESTESLPNNVTDESSGFDTKKNIEAIPTKTFDDGSSGVERQEDPVTSEPFPASEDGVKSSAWTITALDDGVFPDGGDGLSGGGANKGTQPVDPIGVAGDRVDVLEHVTSPANNSGPTDTWSGTDGNKIYRQQDPVTNETLEGSDGVKQAHLFTAFKLADLEVELGLLPVERKYERVAALQEVTGDSLMAQLAYAQRVKTAGFGRQSKTAKRLPVLGRNASTQTTAAVVDDADIPDEALFS